MADNPKFVVNGYGADRLTQVLGLFDEDKVRGYTIDKEGSRLLLFQYGHSNMIPFPAAMPIRDCVPLIMGWIGGPAAYPPEPDIDGSVRKGWLVSRGDHWGHVQPYHHEVLLSIEPEWMMFGK